MTEKIFRLINEVPAAHDIKDAIFYQIEITLEQHGFKVISGEWLTPIDVANVVTPRSRTFVTNPENGKMVPLAEILSLSVKINSTPLQDDPPDDADSDNSTYTEDEAKDQKLSLIVEGAVEVEEQ